MTRSRLPSPAAQVVGWICLALELGGRSSGSNTRSAWTRTQEPRMSSPEHSPQSDGTADSPLVGAPYRARLAAAGALIVLFFLVWFALSLVANDPVGLVLSFVVGVPGGLLRAGSSWSGAAFDDCSSCPWAFSRSSPCSPTATTRSTSWSSMAAMLFLFGVVARYAVRHHQSAALARGAPACTAGAAGNERRADHQPQVGRREGRALRPVGGGEEATHRASAAAAR